VRVAAYFPNVVLLASFLGLGVGALARRVPAWTTAPALVAVVGAGIALSRIAFTSSDPSEHLWLLYYDLPKGAPVVRSVLWPVYGLFVLSALPFVGLGASVARRLGDFQALGNVLRGYTCDLAGSLIGAVAFIALSATSSRPWLWFALPVVLLLVVRHGLRARLAIVACGALTLALAVAGDRDDVYSPYYALRSVQHENGMALLANGSMHQVPLDLRGDRVGAPNSYASQVRAGYRMPLVNLAAPPKRALVLGAGMGNDVSVLLEAGVPEIDAVEIDPRIVELGREKHPASPYADPRVHVHVGDARSFLRSTDGRYDYIVFGTLDSMTRLSALSNVRLDNFVYTREAIEDARRHLSPGGGLALFFMSASTTIDDHLFAALDQAFGRPPLVWRQHHMLFNRIYLEGSGFAHLRTVPELTDVDRTARHEQLEAPTDDWPFVYLSHRTVPPLYLVLAALVLATTAVAVLAASAAMRGDVAGGRVDLEMAAFGAAFLLLETGFVTRLNLLFGATWQSSAIVFASILATLILATVLAARRRIPARGPLAGVALLLVGIAFLPLREIAPASLPARVALALVLCGAPVFLAGLAFADRFSARARAESAFGWNLLGAIAGGLLEFASMALGLRAVPLMATGLYLLLLLARTRGTRSAVLAAT
jgi:spermidine synthase